MNSDSTSHFSRRHFISTTAAAVGAGSIALPGLIDLKAAADGTGETDHFWYRLAPKDGPYIDSHHENKAFARGDGKIMLSEDNCKTWAHSLDFPNADEVNLLLRDNVQPFMGVVKQLSQGNRYGSFLPDQL